MIVAIDPGKRGVGIAVGDDGILWRAAFCADGAPSGIANTVIFLIGREPVDTVVLEVPQVYRAGVSEGDPNDLVTVVTTGAFVAGFLQPRHLETVAPRQWKGTLDGDGFIETRIKPTLTAVEHERVLLPSAKKTLGHNVYDAVGLLLWKFGRLKARKVYPR